MIRLFFILLFVLMSNIVHAQQYFTGNLKAHAGQKISLSGFDYGKTIELDKNTIDSLGYFRLKYPSNYKGMAVLKTQDNSSLFFALTEKEIQLKGEFLRKPQTLSFKNSNENPVFWKYAKEQQIRTQALAAWKFLGPLYQSETLFIKQNKTKELIKNEQQRIEKEDVRFLKNLSAKSYMFWFLPLRKLVQDMPAAVSRYPKRIPKYISAFRNINFKDKRFKNSGLYVQLIEGHYKMLENIGQPIDKMVAEMNLSTSYLINQFSRDKNGLNMMAKHLFHFLEKRSLFKASEFLALTLLERHDKQITPKLANKFESYRKLKVGKIAPDIQLTPQRKLSNIQKTTLLVFVASWCPDCKLTNEQLFKYYPKWKANKKELEIIYVSVDTDKKAFDTVYANAPWKVYADFKGWESQAVKDYHVIGTPSFFLLDKNRKIISRPKSIAQIDAILNTI